MRSGARHAPARDSTQMYVAPVQFADRASGAISDQCLGVIAEFGSREARLSGVAAVHAVPAMAEAAITNEVRGTVAVVQRGAVPLVEKARKAQVSASSLLRRGAAAHPLTRACAAAGSQDAGAVGVLIVNTDERPLLARGHRHRDGRHDSGSDIDIPVVVVPQSAAATLSAGGAEVTLHLEFDVMASSPVPVDDYGTLVQRSALEHEKVPSVPRTVALQPAPEPAAPEPAAPEPEAAAPQQPSVPEGVPARGCTVTFERPGQLGIFFVRGGTMARPRVQVQQVTEDAPRGAREVAQGMLLKAAVIDRKPVDLSHSSYDEVIDLLQSAGRPLELSFEDADILQADERETDDGGVPGLEQLEQRHAAEIERIQSEADSRVAQAEAKAAETDRAAQAVQLRESEARKALEHAHAEALERARSEADSNVATDQKALEKLHADALERVQSEADGRVAAAEAATVTAKEQAAAELQSSQSAQEALETAHADALARVQSEAESRVVAAESEADSRVAAAEAATVTAKEQAAAELQSAREALETAHADALGRVQSEADSRVAAAGSEADSRVAAAETEADSRVAAAEAATAAAKTQTAAEQQSQKALQTTQAEALERVRSEAQSSVAAAEAKAVDAERRAQEHAQAREQAETENSKLKEQVETRLQEAVEASRAELEDAHSAMLRVHAKAEEHISAAEAETSERVAAAQAASHELRGQLDECTAKIASLEQTLRASEDKAREAVQAAEAEAEDRVRAAEERMDEKMTAALEQSRAELDEVAGAMARVQQHAQDWIAEAEVTNAKQIQDAERRAEAEVAKARAQAEQEVSVFREQAVKGVQTARDSDARHSTELDAMRKELQESKWALARAQEQAATVIAEKEHLVALKQSSQTESESRAHSIVEEAQAEVREVQAQAEREVRMALEESRKELESASVAMQRIQENAEKCIAEAEQLAAKKIAAAERIAAVEAQARKTCTEELNILRKTVVEVTQDVDVRVLDKERMATEAETRCRDAIRKATEAEARAEAAKEAAAAAEARAAQAEASADTRGRAATEHWEADLARVTEEADQRVATADARLRELQEHANSEVMKTQAELTQVRLESEQALAASQGADAELGQLQAEKDRLIAVNEDLRAQLNAGQSEQARCRTTEEGVITKMWLVRRQCRAFLGWACVTARSRAAVSAEEASKGAEERLEQQVAMSVSHIREDLEAQLESEVEDVVRRSHEELAEMQATMVRIKSDVETRLGKEARSRERVREEQETVLSELEELRHAKQAAGADISMLRRQLEKTEEVAAEKLDEECSKRDAAEARALTAEKQARLAVQKARAAEEALQGERSARETAEAEIEASRTARAKAESREVSRHKKDAEMRKAFEEAAWRKAEDEKKAREAAEKKLQKAKQPGRASPAKKRSRKPAERRVPAASSPQRSSESSRPNTNARRAVDSTPESKRGGRTGGAGRRAVRKTASEVKVKSDTVDGLLSEFMSNAQSDFAEVRPMPLPLAGVHFCSHDRPSFFFLCQTGSRGHGSKLEPPPAPNPQLVSRQVCPSERARVFLAPSGFC